MWANKKKKEVVVKLKGTGRSHKVRVVKGSSKCVKVEKGSLGFAIFHA